MCMATFINTFCPIALELSMCMAIFINTFCPIAPYSPKHSAYKKTDIRRYLFLSLISLGGTAFGRPHFWTHHFGGALETDTFQPLSYFVNKLRRDRLWSPAFLVPPFRWRVGGGYFSTSKLIILFIHLY